MSKLKRVLKYSLRTLRATVVAVLLLLLLGLWGLRSPWAQAKLVPLAEQLLSEALGVPVSVGSVDIDLPSHAVLQGLEMRDQQGQPIFAVREAKLGFASFSILKFILFPDDPHPARLHHVALMEPEAHLYRSRRDSTWNYAFLSTSDPDTSPSKPLPLEIHLPAVELRGGKFSMVDSTRAEGTLGPDRQINFNSLHLDRINADMDFHFMPEQMMYGHVGSLTVREHYAGQTIDKLSSDYQIYLDPHPPSHLTMCFENSILKLGQTELHFDGQLEDIRPDSGHTGFYPVFSAHFRPSAFDFRTLNRLLPNDMPLAQPLQLAGYVYGDLHQINSDSLDIGLLQHTRLRARVALTDYISAENLKFKGEIAGGVLSFEELQALLPRTDVPLHGIVRLRGPISGDLHQLKAPNLDVAFMNNTRLHVNARLMEYTRGDDIFMDIKFKESQFSFTELRSLIPDMSLPSWLGRFGTCGIDGKFLGGINDFVVNAEMTSAFGDLTSNLHLILPPKAREIAYDGHLVTRNINLEGLQAELPVHSRYLNFDGDIKGSGTKWGKIVADVNGRIHESDIEGYHIDEVVSKDVKVRGYHISGGVDVRDAQGNASVTVDLDVPDTAQRYFVVGDVKDLDLAHYGVIPSDSVFLSAIVNVDVEGKELEDYTGKMRFLQAGLKRKGSADSLTLNNVVLTSRRDAQERHLIKLRSSVADMDMLGNFKYGKAVDMIAGLAKETRLYIKNKDSLTAAYYASKVIDTEEFWIRDTVTTKGELNHIFAFFQMPLYLLPGSKVYAQFEHTGVDELDVEVLSDSAAYGNVGLKGNAIGLTLQKDVTQNYLLGHGQVLIKKLNVGENLHFEQVSFEPNADASQVDYFLRATQPEIGSEYILSAQTNFQPGGDITTRINAGESKIVIRRKTWRFAPGGSVDHHYQRPPSLAKSITDSVISRYHINGIKLYSDGQEIKLGGIVSRDRKDLMNVDIKNLNIGNVLAVLDTTQDMDGTLKRATFGIWNLFSGQPSIYGSGEVQDFRYHRVDSIGMRFFVGWPYIFGPDYAGMRIEVGNWGRDSLITKGWYNVANDSLHFDSDSSRIQLSWIEPFVEDYLSDMEGQVALDDFTLRGTLLKPELNGVARFTNTSFKVDYLNNVFRLGDGQLNFDNERIQIPRLLVHDTLSGSAEVSGNIYYNDDRGIRLSIGVHEINDMLFMDTRNQHNELFYGHVILDGDSARVTGTAERPYIQAWVGTGDGSWLDIPISDYTSASRLDFVNFVQKGDTLKKSIQTDFGGMEMSLNVKAHDNARVRLIFDEFVGDMIEARGDGAINVVLTEAGEFNMFGTYTLTKGDYHFTLENILNKKFVVEPGGQIVWNGDPFDAQVNLNAIYKVNADIGSLFGGGGGGNRVPVAVLMRMKGSLMTPEIALELMLDQLSDQDALGLASYFRGITYDEQELNKQVVSLLLFGRFAPTGSTGGTSANVASSISELVSNQVNHWLSQTFNDPNIGVEVNSNEFQDVNVLLRASLFNDRVTVERNGTLIGNTNNNNGNLSIGDLSVLIKVLPKPDTTGGVNPKAGQLVMEIFNREDFSVTTNNVSRGAGIFYKKDFDRLSDFLKQQHADARKEEGVQ